MDGWSLNPVSYWKWAFDLRWGIQVLTRLVKWSPKIHFYNFEDENRTWYIPAPRYEYEGYFFFNHLRTGRVLTRNWNYGWWYQFIFSWLHGSKWSRNRCDDRCVGISSEGDSLMCGGSCHVFRLVALLEGYVCGENKNW